MLIACSLCCSRFPGVTASAAAALTVAVLTKPQALPFLVPFAAWFFARGGGLGLLRAGAIGLGVAVVLWLPFVTTGGLFHYIGNYLGDYQNDVYSVLSLRAWNFWWIAQEFAPVDEFVSDRVPIVGPLTFRVLGFLIVGVLSIFVASRVWRDPRPRTLVLGLAATTLVGFTFLTTMHERYAYGALLFLMLLIPEARVRWLGAAVGVVFTVNLVAAVPATSELGRLLPMWSGFSFIGSMAMVGLTVLVLLELGGPRNTRPHRSQTQWPEGRSTIGSESASQGRRASLPPDHSDGDQRRESISPLKYHVGIARQIATGTVQRRSVRAPQTTSAIARSRRGTSGTGTTHAEE